MVRPKSGLAGEATGKRTATSQRGLLKGQDTGRVSHPPPCVFPEALRAVGELRKEIGHLTLRAASHIAGRGTPRPASPAGDTRDSIEHSLPWCQRECMPLTFDIPGFRSLVVGVDDKKGLLSFLGQSALRDEVRHVLAFFRASII
jgi:hypothetical protein